MNAFTNVATANLRPAEVLETADGPVSGIRVGSGTSPRTGARRVTLTHLSPADFRCITFEEITPNVWRRITR